MEWRRGKYHTCVWATTFRHDYNTKCGIIQEQTKYRLNYSPISEKGVCCIYCNTKGDLPQWNDMTNWQLPDSVGVKITRLCATTTQTMYMVIFSIQNNIRILEVKTKTKIQIMSWYWIIGFVTFYTWVKS